MSEPTPKFLAIKNWRKYQAIEDDGGRAPWIKDYVDKDTDIERMKLTGFQAAILDRLYRLRARHAHILHNDITWLIQATYLKHRDATHMPHTIRTLITHNFIIPTDDENFETSAAVEVMERKGRGKGTGERETGSGSLKKEKDKSNPSGASGDQAKKKSNPNPLKDCGCADGLCDWSEPITGCAHPTSVGDAVYYQRHIKRNDWFIPKLTAGYVRKEWKRILADTPEDYVYDADPMIKEKRIHLEGESIVQKHVMRRPKTTAERALLQKNPENNREWLYDPACPYGCKNGLIFVSDNPDAELPIQRQIGHSEYCECLMKEEVTEATA
jgi:hypothetical protein